MHEKARVNVVYMHETCKWRIYAFWDRNQIVFQDVQWETYIYVRQSQTSMQLSLFMHENI